MNRYFKHLLFSLVLFIAVLCCFSFCDDSINPFANPIIASAYSELNTNDLYITKGDTYQLKVKRARGNVKWSSEDPRIASVSNNGKVKAKKRGSTYIVAEEDYSIHFCYVTVETPKISKSKLTLIKGSSYELSLKGTTRIEKWSSSEKSIAKVSKYGTVYAKKAGSATITARLGNHDYTCTVTVEAPKLSQKQLILEPNSQCQLNLTGTTQKVKWGSYNNKVATVSSTGLVSAVGKGKTTVYAKVGGVAYRCEVNVENPYLSDSKLVLLIEDSHYMSVYNTYQDEKWTSSNTKVATIDDYGEIDAVGAGSCIITCDLGYKTLTCNVLVEDPAISKEEVVLTEGQTTQLVLLGTTQVVKWSSTDTAIATVSDSGLVSAIKAGHARIYASIGTTSYSCSIDVKDAPVDLNQIQTTYYDTGFGIVGILKNNYKAAVDIEMIVLYYDAKGGLVDKRTESTYALKTGKEAAIKVVQPYDGNTYEDLDYASYKVELNVEKSSYDNSELLNDSIGVEDTNTGNKVIVKFTNNSQIEVDRIKAAIVFYDSKGNCIGFDYAYPECDAPGKSEYVNFDYPYNGETYENIIPASYKVYVNYAYNW